MVCVRDSLTVVWLPAFGQQAVTITREQMDVVAIAGLILIILTFAVTVYDAWRGKQQDDRQRQERLDDLRPEFDIVENVIPRFIPSPSQNPWLDATAAKQSVNVQNVGRGMARDMRAVLFGCKRFLRVTQTSRTLMDAPD